MSLPATLNWDLMVALYFFFSGISVGAIILACLPLVFGFKRYRPIAGLALITGLVFGIMTALVILPHLTQPARWWTLATVIQTASPMSWGVFILISYLLLILVGGRLAYGSALMNIYNQSTGMAKTFYKILLLGKTDITHEAEKRQAMIARVIFGAAFLVSLLFVYQGFEIGILAGRPLWYSTITPFLFILTSVASGFSLVMIGWIVLNKYFTKQKELRVDMLSELAVITLAILVILVGLIIGEYITVLSADVYKRLAISALFIEPNLYIFVLIGIVLGAIIPAILLTIPRGRNNVAVLLLSSILITVGMFAVKLGILIAGQMFAKVPSLPPSLTKVLMSPLEAQLGVGALALAILLYLLFVWLLPWRHVVGGVE